MSNAKNMKQEIAERLLRGEDVEITLEDSGTLRTDEAFVDIQPANTETGDDVYDVPGGGPMSRPQKSAHTEQRPSQPPPSEHNHQEQSASELPVELIIDRLSARVGQLATEIAILEAKLIMLEGELRNH